MKELHERSIRSTTLTIAGYLREIRTLLDAEHGLHDCSNGRLSPEEQGTAASALANMEGIIERYREELGIPKGEVDQKWKLLVLAETMENLVHDMSAERLDKKYGPAGTAAERAKIGQLQAELREQIRRLKDVSAGRIT